MIPKLPNDIGPKGSIFSFYPEAKGQLLGILQAMGHDPAQVDMGRLEDSLVSAADDELLIELTPGTEKPGIPRLAIDRYLENNDS